MFNFYLDYLKKSVDNLNKGNVRVACMFLGRASSYLDVSFNKGEISKALYIRHLEKIDEIWGLALTK